MCFEMSSNQLVKKILMRGDFISLSFHVFHPGMSHINSTKETARIGKLLEKGKQDPPSNIQRDNGSHTSNIHETVVELVKKKFADCIEKKKRRSKTEN
jgi:hypothetical protein